MEDESKLLEGKGLLNMRVVDLKQELEKRGLSKSGSKKDLVKRLKQQLEFEKLCEERKSGDFDLNLELDAEIQQNEFVQQYLAQQQKRYAERKEEKRLEFEAMQKCQEEGSTINTEHQSAIDENKLSDNESAEKVTQNENKDAISLKSVESNTNLPISECELKDEIHEENTPSPSFVSVCNTDVKNSHAVIQNLNNVTKIEDAELTSKFLFEIGSEKLKVSEYKEKTYDETCIADNIVDSKGQKQFEEISSNESFHEDDPNVTVKAGNIFTESDKCQSNQSISPFASKEIQNIASHFVSSKKDSSESSSKQKSSENMEVSDCSPVPYSLSDIQLPESPRCYAESNDSKCTERNQMDHVSDEVTDESTHSKNKNKSDGDRMHGLNSSQEEVSESETKDSSYSSDSPEKMKVVKSKSHSDESSDAESHTDKISYKKKSVKYEDTSSNLAADSDDDHPTETVHKGSYSSDSPEKNKRHSDESTDTEPHTNKISYKKKSLKYEDTSPNLAVDSDDDHSKEPVHKEQKYTKSQQNSDESDSEKSSNSEKYNRHVELKRKIRGKHRKRDSRSSSSSSSRSSDSSPEKRRSKKSNVAKSKGFIDERHQASAKNSDKKSMKYKKNDSTAENSEDNVSLKKRVKIDRDIVPIEKPSPTKESVDISPANKTREKNSSSHSTYDKPSKQESHDEKNEKSDVNFKSRKVASTNQKLNRKSSESNIEPRSKLSRWEGFASGQKYENPDTSANSLRNCFPDFKLASETSVDTEQDEHSLSAPDEKFGDVTQNDALNENESSMKQESTSQMDVEDSISQELNFDETVEVGPVSKIIFIQNLVRPFTLNQLKDLLKQSGKIVEENFWIDKIKSKCFVMYETEKEAIKAKNALNNTRWPTSNPKILAVEFSDLEELEKHQKGNESQILKPSEPPAIESSDVQETRVPHIVEEHKRKDKERRKDKDRTKIQAPVREWDKDKIVQDSPEREHPQNEEKSRNAEKKEKKESKKRTTEDTPAKLLDDLFQKTKSVPCIYWLPLTEEQAKAKEEQRKTRRLEREKRNQQLKEQEEAERRNRRARSSSRRREKENRKSSTRSRSPVSRRR